MAAIYSSSSTVAWLRTSHSAPANTTAPTARIITFFFVSRYMPHMKSSMTIIIMPPITNIIQKRVSLQKT